MDMYNNGQLSVGGGVMVSIAFQAVHVGLGSTHANTFPFTKEFLFLHFSIHVIVLLLNSERK